MLAELRHPNIILFMGAATKPQFCFITEFMPRGNLFEYDRIDDVVSKEHTLTLLLGTSLIVQSPLMTLCV